MPVQKLRIFLSHVTIESRLADLLKAHLVRDFIGLLDVFESSDRLSIPAGSKWLDEVTSALRSADLHLILCSSEAIGRPWINFEAGAAHLRGIRLLPICHSGLTPAQLPVPLSESEAVIASHEEGLRSLYRTIAGALGSDIPAIDFEALALAVRQFEGEYGKERSRAVPSVSLKETVETIENPKALCISSPQFRALGFENQLQTVLDAFPAATQHLPVLSSRELSEAVRNEQFDIVHIAAYVCPRSGDLYFSDVDITSGVGLSREPDVLPAETLAWLLKEAGVKLVVIGSCDSLALTATLTSVCHVIATRDMVSAKMMAAWVEAFYELLPHSSLSEALTQALTFSKAPMRFYGKQTNPIVTFKSAREHELVAP